MDNVYASRMGRALSNAETLSFGDSIDRGLGLFNELNRLGFEVRVKSHSCMSALDIDTPLQNGPTRFVRDHDELELYASRYQYLRNVDLDKISVGGVFAGMTPENVVLNEEHLDLAVDIEIRKALQEGK
ncbi:MAG: hypothetical protein COA69_13525 [Robiginitomaculum sp.]|nr:MAG: hypothetical protein COA69_13525 [Robiginitomaculum sp.]